MSTALWERANLQQKNLLERKGVKMDTKVINTYDIYLNNTNGEMEFITRY